MCDVSQVKQFKSIICVFSNLSQLDPSPWLNYYIHAFCYMAINQVRTLTNDCSEWFVRERGGVFFSTLNQLQRKNYCEFVTKIHGKSFNKTNDVILYDHYLYTFEHFLMIWIHISYVLILNICISTSLMAFSVQVSTIFYPIGKKKTLVAVPEMYKKITRNSLTWFSRRCRTFRRRIAPNR